MIKVLAFGRVQLQLIVRCSDDAIKASQFEHLPLHLCHVAAEVENQVVAHSVGDVHASLESVPFRGSKHDIHLLIGKMVLQELLVVKAVSRTGYNVYATQNFVEHLDRHDGVRIRPI